MPRLVRLIWSGLTSIYARGGGNSIPLPWCARINAPCRGEAMPKLVTASQFPDADAAYLALVVARRDLSDAQAAQLDTRLVLILANHIGDLGVLREAIALARQTA